MSARNYTQTLTAGQQITLPGGRYLFVKTATAPVDIATDGKAGAPGIFSGVTSGFKYGPVPEGQAWTTLRLTSATAQAIEVYISDDDLVDIAGAVSIVGAVNIAPASGVVDQAAISAPDAATTTIVAQNTSRKRVTLWTDTVMPTPAAVFFRFGGGVQNIMEVIQGVRYTFEGTYQIAVNNNCGAALSFGRFEETQ